MSATSALAVSGQSDALTLLIRHGGNRLNPARSPSLIVPRGTIDPLLLNQVDPFSSSAFAVSTALQPSRRSFRMITNRHEEKPKLVETPCSLKSITYAMDFHFSKAAVVSNLDSAALGAEGFFSGRHAPAGSWQSGTGDSHTTPGPRPLRFNGLTSKTGVSSGHSIEPAVSNLASGALRAETAATPVLATGNPALTSGPCPLRSNELAPRTGVSDGYGPPPKT